MRRWKLLVTLAGTAIALLAVGALLLWPQPLLLWPRPSRITLENYDRITSDMTGKEIEAILGPPGDYRTGPIECVGGTVEESLRHKPGTAPRSYGEYSKFWFSDTASIFIEVHLGGNVHKEYTRCRPIDRSTTVR